MMATTLIPPSTVTSRPAVGETRFVSIRANLMPEEVLSSRQVVVVRKQVLLGLVVVVLMLIAWFGLSWWQTHSAQSDLSDLQRQGLALQSQQSQYTPLVQAQEQISNTRTQLEQLMVGDLSWKTMLTALRDKAPAGVTVDSITGTITASGADGQVLNQTGSASVGQLSITGTAPDKRTVAAYADALGQIKGVTAALIASVEATARPITFTVTAVITTDALGGKYATSTPATGGN